MTLQKKIQRSVKKNLSFYLTGSILTAITVMLLVGAVTVSGSLYHCFDAYFAETKIEDAEFATLSEIPEDEMEQLKEQYDVTIEKQQYQALCRDRRNGSAYGDRREKDRGGG